MRLVAYSIYFILGATFFTGCIEPYPAPISSENVDFLVVDGFVSTTGEARVTLSRAIPLATNSGLPPSQSGALVTLEDNNGDAQVLNESSPGVYLATGVPVTTERQYRIRINVEAKEYVSDFITIKDSPPIDSVSWVPTLDGVEVRVNTHDDTKQSRYYKWSFEETWQYTSVFDSYYKYDHENEQIVERPSSESIYTCWRTASSQRILVGSSDRLATDVISEFPLTLIPKGSQKLFIRYSVLVKQYVLSREAYDYWSYLQKTTESLGGLFDPMPGRINSNIHNVSDPNEPVLGYFSGGAIQEKRKFISVGDLPYSHMFFLTPGDCTPDTLLFGDIPRFSFEGAVLIRMLYQEAFPIGYSYTNETCGDCRTQGGNTIKPSFW